ncbi:hypothetical protein HHK36_030453 [Tetracentron sinense]|uniref:Uncharacterized protein n=1 Tax=Tetracentron sinense TaxID=13715 RepID=A0A835CYR5_TETSI|nr:hypothetical protein HHK36_030453 [Tetracentron sinense]
MGPFSMNNKRDKLERRILQEESDYGYDLGIAGRCKRRRLLSNNYNCTLEKTSGANKMKVDLVDHDYQMFLKILREKEDADFVEDDTDPDYKMFLEHLREDKNSYIFEMMRVGQTPVFIKYEGKDGLSNETKKETLRSLRNISSREKRDFVVKKNLKSEPFDPVSREIYGCLSQKPGPTNFHQSLPGRNCGTENAMVGDSYGIKAETLRSLGNISSRGRRDSVVKKNPKLEPLGPVSCGTNGCLNQKPGPTFFQPSLSNRKCGVQSAMVDDSYVIKPEAPSNLRTISSRGIRDSVVKKNLTLESLGPVSPGTRGCLSQKTGPMVFHPSHPNREYGTESAMVDDSYGKFLDSLRTDGKILILVTEDGNWVKYEDDNEVPSDSEIVASFTPSRHVDSSMNDDDWGCIERPSDNNQSEFKENLMAILKMPYDQKEYEELLKEATTQKQLERNRYLRGRIVSYPTKRTSFSYLDHHPDLENKINLVRDDHHRVLNLLRGFFFWLKNLSHEGAVKPWLDTSCLETMLRCSHFKQLSYAFSLRGICYCGGDECRCRLLPLTLSPELSPPVPDQMTFAAPSGSCLPGNRPYYQHCHKPGHVIDRCFDLYLELKQRYSRNRDQGNKDRGKWAPRTGVIAEVALAPSISDYSQLQS